MQKNQHEQIEQMKNDICEIINDTMYHLLDEDDSRYLAENLYDADYRKQSEGEWEELDRDHFNCTHCGQIFGLGSTSTIYDVKRVWKYCPNCGGMKNTKCPDRKNCWDYGDCETCERGNHILKLHKRIDCLKKQNETLTIQRNAWALTAKNLAPQWISVDERLPENGLERVLVMLKDIPVCDHIGTPRVDTDRYIDGRWVRWDICITHWMPLPKAPKEGGK